VGLPTEITGAVRHARLDPAYNAPADTIRQLIDQKRPNQLGSKLHEQIENHLVTMALIRDIEKPGTAGDKMVAIEKEKSNVQRRRDAAASP
jgi:hypothetical protein